MHKPSAVLRLEQRLADLGCPAGERERRTRELADHYEDLKLAGLEEGLSEAAAEARANERLGEPVLLGDQLAAVLTAREDATPRRSGQVRERPVRSPAVAGAR